MENAQASLSYIHLTILESTQITHPLETLIAATKDCPKDVAVSRKHIADTAFGYGTAPTMHADTEGHSELTCFYWARKAQALITFLE